MSRFLLAVALAVFAPAIVLAQPPRPKLDAEATELRDYIKAHYTKYEYRIPMRDGVKLFTAVYVPKDDSQDLPDPADPHAVQRRALRRRPVPGRPRPVAAVRQGGLHLRLPGRARPVDVGGRVRQHAAAQPGQEGPKDIDESTDTYDTIDWLLKNVKPQRQGRAVGHLVPRLLHRLPA